jgi:hypothetical protein
VATQLGGSQVVLSTIELFSSLGVYSDKTFHVPNFKLLFHMPGVMK